MGFFFVHLLAGGSYSYTMPTGSQTGAETSPAKTYILPFAPCPMTSSCGSGNGGRLTHCPPCARAAGAQIARLKASANHIQVFCIYCPPDDASTTDRCGSIRNVQINAPASITAAETKKGAIQKPLSK